MMSKSVKKRIAVQRRPAIAKGVALAKREIMEDVQGRRVPLTIKSFSALHTYVDANQYGGGFDPKMKVETLNAIQGEIDTWVASKGLLNDMADVHCAEESAGCVFCKARRMLMAGDLKRMSVLIAVPESWDIETASRQLNKAVAAPAWGIKVVEVHGEDLLSVTD